MKRNKLHIEEGFPYVLHKTLSVCKQEGYQEIKLPTVAETSLLNFGMPQAEIAQEQVFYLESSRHSRKHLLRPEGTFLSLDVIKEKLNTQKQQKICYVESMFRKERTQKGRYQEFYQLGLEHIGYDPLIQVCEVLYTSWNVLCALNLQDKVQLHINNIGSSKERNLYSRQIRYFLDNVPLNDKQKHTLKHNTLRILDTKDLYLKQQLDHAPKISDFIEEKQQYLTILDILDKLEINYKEQPYLVRGLDYYSGIVFEWILKENASSELNNTLCGGGQYLLSALNPYFKDDITGCGCAFGIERLYLAALENGYRLNKHIDDIYIFLGDSNDWLNAIIFKRDNCSHLKTYLNPAIRSSSHHLKKARLIKANYCLQITKGKYRIYNRNTKDFSEISIKDLIRLIQ